MRSAWLKRAFDIVLLIPSGLILSPLVIAIVLFIGLYLGKHILYKQIRPGKDGKPFTLYKFRTMTFARDEHGDLLPDEDRLPSFGRYLRKFSLDELPELWNVLKGEMSLVGPRPLLMEYLDDYTPREARRHDMKPGVTGLAQISGRNTLTLKQKCELDVWYVENWSILLDVQIIIRTVIKVLRGEGVLISSYRPKLYGNQVINGSRVKAPVKARGQENSTRS